MKKIFFTVIVFVLLSVPASATWFPNVPVVGREHYVIYREGARDNRIELALFDIDSENEIITWDNSLNSQGYCNEIKYYLDNGAWIEFTDAGSAVSAVLQSDVNIIDTDGKIRLYGQNADGALKDFPEITKKWNEITTSTITNKHEFYTNNNKLDLKHNLLPYVFESEYKDYTVGHFLDIEGFDESVPQMSFALPDGYAVIPRFQNYRAGTFLGHPGYGEPPLEKIEYDPQKYNKIYFTDENYNLKYIAEADFSKYETATKEYIICVDAVIHAGGENFAILRHCDIGHYDLYRRYDIQNDMLAEISGEEILIPPLESPYHPVSANDKMALFYNQNHTSSCPTGTIMKINGRNYRLSSENINTLEYPLKFRGGYIIYHPASKEYGSDIISLAFTKDYTNFAHLPLLKPLSSKNPYLKPIDDQFCMLLSGYYSHDEYSMDIHIFSYAMIDELMATQLPEAPVYIAYKDSLLVFEIPPRIVNGRTMIPIRTLFEKMGAKVNWDDSSRMVTISKDSTEVKIAIGDNFAYINGEYTPLDTETMLISDTAMVPLRFISEAFGYDVSWNDEYRLVNIEEK